MEQKHWPEARFFGQLTGMFLQGTERTEKTFPRMARMNADQTKASFLQEAAEVTERAFDRGAHAVRGIINPELETRNPERQLCALLPASATSA